MFLDCLKVCNSFRKWEGCACNFRAEKCFPMLILLIALVEVDMLVLITHTVQLHSAHAHLLALTVEELFNSPWAVSIFSWKTKKNVSDDLSINNWSYSAI